MLSTLAGPWPIPVSLRMWEEAPEPTGSTNPRARVCVTSHAARCPCSAAPGGGDGRGRGGRAGEEVAGQRLPAGP